MDYKNNCLELYTEAFGTEDSEFRTALFDKCFKYCKFLKQNGEIVSMLFLLPCELKSATDTLNINYIYAAATLKSQRGKGYMSKLIENVKANGELLFLRPANDGLIEFYKKLGFQVVQAQKSDTLPAIFPKDSFADLTELFPEEPAFQNYTAMYYSPKDKKFDNLNFIYTME